MLGERDFGGSGGGTCGLGRYLGMDYEPMTADCGPALVTIEKGKAKERDIPGEAPCI